MDRSNAYISTISHAQRQKLYDTELLQSGFGTFHSYIACNFVIILLYFRNFKYSLKYSITQYRVTHPSGGFVELTRINYNYNTSPLCLLTEIYVKIMQKYIFITTVGRLLCEGLSFYALCKKSKMFKRILGWRTNFKDTEANTNCSCNNKGFVYF